MALDTLFRETLPTALNRNPDLAKQARVVVRIDLTGDARETWTLNLREDPPRVVPGAEGQPQVTVIADREQFEELASSGDARRWIDAYVSGALQVQGGLVHLVRLRRLWKVHFPEEQVAAPEGTGRRAA